MRWLDSITDSVDMNLRNSKRRRRTEELGVLQFMGLLRAGRGLATEWQEHGKH